ncbi:unnamed protein product, partial [marine sediment metagenome]
GFVLAGLLSFILWDLIPPLRIIQTDLGGLIILGVWILLWYLVDILIGNQDARIREWWNKLQE